MKKEIFTEKYDYEDKAIVTLAHEVDSRWRL